MIDLVFWIYAWCHSNTHRACCMMALNSIGQWYLPPGFDGSPTGNESADETETSHDDEIDLNDADERSLRLAFAALKAQSNIHLRSTLTALFHDTFHYHHYFISNDSRHGIRQLQKKQYSMIWLIFEMILPIQFEIIQIAISNVSLKCNRGRRSRPT